MPSDRTVGRPTTRRTFIALAGLTALAGCSSAPSVTGTDAGGTDADGAETDPGSDPGSGPGSDPDADAETPETPLLGYDAAVDHDRTDWKRYDPDWTAPSTSPLASPPTAEVLIENLEIPWDISVAADGSLFLTERVGNVLAFDGDDVRQVASPADAIDAGSVEPGADESSWWVQGGEGGTLGVAAHPGYPDPPLVYVYYTYETDDERWNKVVAFDVAADRPEDHRETVVDRIPGHKIHNGGRITFGPANYLWITTGDAGDSDNAQDPSSLGGMVLRVTPTGDPAPDNPDLGGDPRVYTYGHRNPQGIVWLPDGTPVVSEHGPSGRDEINRLEAGANYGWRDTRRREEYLDADGVHPPLANTGEDTWAPTGSLFYTGDAVPSLTNRMLTGALRGQRLLVTTFTPPDGDLPPAAGGTRFDGEWTDDAYTATTHSLFEDELGRIRHVEQGPAGELYLVTSNRDGRAEGPFPTERDDVLARIVPGE